MTGGAGMESVAEIGGFAFETGQEFPSLRLGYTTYGSLNGNRNNAVLLTPGTSGDRNGYRPYIGPGNIFDTDRYFIIAVDGLGGGLSSSPRDGLGTKFPRYTIRDMVRAQHRLVVHHLGLSDLMAVGGPSMGSFQAIEWGLHFPDFVRGLLMLVPAPKASATLKALVDVMVEIMTLDRAWEQGRYRDNPVNGLRCAGLMFGPWCYSETYLAQSDPISVPGSPLTKLAENFVNWDAASWMWRYLASRDFDPSTPFGGDLGKTLARIRTASLIMPNIFDRILPVEGARFLHEAIPRSTYSELPSSAGHRTPSPATASTDVRAIMRSEIGAFLDGL